MRRVKPAPLTCPACSSQNVKVLDQDPREGWIAECYTCGQRGPLHNYKTTQETMDP